ncbi:hypothetical protein NLI96_g2480 [Meripilus lineatus]|uniref:Major facilitator superfamily (MFS) profile domain-containing protein n=1 Tax=Meripilus lineatus TaxID=2056292 RepID=A0AAD5YJX7_9APHY|nr:hypothetical protein NLI96_g2480 [Physisporinus lineatus]
MDTPLSTEKRDSNIGSSDGSKSNRESKVVPDDPYQVTLGPEDDPKNLPVWRKWLTVAILNAGAMNATGASSMAASAEVGISQEFHVSLEVATLGVSMFVLGTGLGPFLMGSVAEVTGQRRIYLMSFLLAWAFAWPVAFSHSLAVHLIFRFLGGLCGSAFLSIAGGTVSDMFTDDTVATPMATYTISTFVGPNMVPVFSGFVVERAGWRWLYYTLIIWNFVQFIALFAVPETYEPIILKWKAQHLRKSTGDDRFYAPLERESTGILHRVWIGCWHILELILYDRMILLLDLWLALILGIVYLAFQSYPIIFITGHNFSVELLGLTFIGVNIGFAIAMFTQVFWNKARLRAMVKHNNNPPPEVWLVMGQYGAVLVPIGLYIMAFTTYQNVHWIGPIIGSVPFGIGVCYVYTSTFTYLVTAFRPMAAAAMSGSAILRSCFAAGFPMFANSMYDRLGTVGATALLAGLTTVMAPLPFIFQKYGACLRAKSGFAAHLDTDQLPEKTDIDGGSQ